MIRPTKLDDNPVRYSIPMLLFITACLLLAQHYLPTTLRAGMNSDDLIARSGGNSARQVAYLVLGLIGFVGAYATRRKHVPFVKNLRVIVPLALLLAWCVLSIGWSDMAMIATKRIVVVGLMFLGSFGLAVSWKSTDILRFITFSSALQVSIGFVSELALGYFNPAASAYRFGGTLTPNEQGYLCMVLIISSMCLGKAMQVQGSATWLCRTLAAYGFILLLLTRSRGALLGLAIAALFYFLLVVHAHHKTLAVFLIGTFTLVLVMSGVGAAILNTLDRGGQGSEDLTGRAPLWTELMGYVDERPWVGRGYESFWNAQTMDDVYQHQHWPVDSAHSQYVESLLTIGIIGMALHTIALLAGMIEGIRLFRSGRDLVYFLASAMCCIYLACGSLEALLIVKPSSISFYLAMLLCSMMVHRQPDEVLVPVKSSARFYSTRKIEKLASPLTRTTNRLSGD